ncbi:integrase core domain-containing protein [Candidatus Palauibacter sp.]|uniref:integrase core domain-containing protein n=1 Tax=Candidatus Palauibacter sp. TaxID=3101350 RepID=UPI003B0233E9
MWRSLKYEAVYLHELRDGLDAERIIGSWFDFYNEVRPHSSLGGRTPGDAYHNGTGRCERRISTPVAGRALASPRGRAETWDLPVPDASHHRRPSPGRRPGFPPGHRGSCWNPSFPCRGRTYGWSTHSKTTHGECSRGLSQSLGIHPSFALGLSQRSKTTSVSGRRFLQI